MTERRKTASKLRRPSPKLAAGSTARGRERIGPRDKPALREIESGPELDAGAFRALIIILATLTAARALLAFVPAMWGWGLNLMRFLSPIAAWVPWSFAALTLLPPVSRRLAPGFARLGDAIAHAPVWTGLLLAIPAAILVWSFPDRARFVGDFLLRQGALTMGARMGTLIPQALPLDILLHYRLPIALASAGLVAPDTAARLLGALDAALLAMLSVAFARVLGFGGVAAVASAAVVFFGGYLALFTGYSKAFVELAVITAAVGVFGIRVVKEGRGLLPLGAALAAGIAIHRSGIALLGAAAFAWVIWVRRHGAREALRRPAVIAGVALPLLVLAVMLPRILDAVFGYDAAMHLFRSDGSGQNLWGALIGGTRALDGINMVLMFSPLALAIPVLWWLHRRRFGVEIGYLTVLAAPWLAMLVAVRPLQGLHRDWDVFAAGGVAWSLLVAAMIGETLRSSGRRRWLGVAVTFAVMMPTVQLLVVHAQIERGLARARAFAKEPPRRTERDRGATWDYVGIRSVGLQRWEEAAEAFAHTAETMPSPRVLMQWAYAVEKSGDFEAAQGIYRRLLEKTPKDLLAWEQLALLSLRRGDVEESRRAARELLRRDPSHRTAAQILARLGVDSLGAKPPR